MPKRQLIRVATQNQTIKQDIIITIFQNSAGKILGLGVSNIDLHADFLPKTGNKFSRLFVFRRIDRDQIYFQQFAVFVFSIKHLRLIDGGGQFLAHIFLLCRLARALVRRGTQGLVRAGLGTGRRRIIFLPFFYQGHHFFFHILLRRQTWPQLIQKFIGFAWTILRSGHFRIIARKTGQNRTIYYLALIFQGLAQEPLFVNGVL